MYKKNNYYKNILITLGEYKSSNNLLKKYFFF